MAYLHLLLRLYNFWLFNLRRDFDWSASQNARTRHDQVTSILHEKLGKNKRNRVVDSKTDVFQHMKRGYTNILQRKRNSRNSGFLRAISLHRKEDGEIKPRKKLFRQEIRAVSMAKILEVRILAASTFFTRLVYRPLFPSDTTYFYLIFGVRHPIDFAIKENSIVIINTWLTIALFIYIARVKI